MSSRLMFPLTACSEPGKESTVNEQQEKRLVNRRRYVEVEGKFLSLIVFGTSLLG